MCILNIYVYGRNFWLTSDWVNCTYYLKLFFKRYFIVVSCWKGKESNTVCIIVILIVCFLLSFCRSEKQYITLPKNIEDAKNLGKVLSRYKDLYYYQVFSGYFITYILYPFCQKLVKGYFLFLCIITLQLIRIFWL